MLFPELVFKVHLAGQMSQISEDKSGICATCHDVRIGAGCRSGEAVVMVVPQCLFRFVAVLPPFLTLVYCGFREDSLTVTYQNAVQDYTKYISDNMQHNDCTVNPLL